MEKKSDFRAEADSWAKQVPADAYYGRNRARD